MVYRVVLVPVLGDPADKSALDVTRTLTEQMHSHIVGLHVRTPIATLIMGSVFRPMVTPAELINRYEENNRIRASAAHDKFRTWQQACGIISANHPARRTSRTADWIDVEAPLADEIACHARTSDLVVLARSPRSYTAARDEALFGSLFHSGRPTLLVPGDREAGPFDTVMIAWNDSREAAHAVAAAWSFIGRAKRIVVFVGGIDQDSRRAADRFISHLAWRGYASATVVGSPSTDTGAALLSAAHREQAGLIIMGAYTHGRLRHLVFGGATSYVLANTTIPILMAH